MLVVGTAAAAAATVVAVAAAVVERGSMHVSMCVRVRARVHMCIRMRMRRTGSTIMHKSRIKWEWEWRCSDNGAPEARREGAVRLRAMRMLYLPSISLWSYVRAMYIIGRMTISPLITTGRSKIPCIPKIAD